MQLKSIAALLIVGAASVPGLAQATGNGWYVSPNVSYVITDSHRPKSDGWGVGMAVGKQVNDAWNVEASGRYLQMNNTKDELASVGVDGLYFFNRNPSLSPYAIMGAGYAYEDRHGGGQHNFMVNAGFGVLTQYSKDVDLRAEARYHWHDNEGNVFGASSLGDWLFTFGVNVALDGK